MTVLEFFSLNYDCKHFLQYYVTELCHDIHIVLERYFELMVDRAELACGRKVFHTLISLYGTIYLDQCHNKRFEYLKT